MKTYIIFLFLFSILSQYVFSLENKTLIDGIKVAEPKLDVNSFDDSTTKSEAQIEISDRQLENNQMLVEHFLNLAIDEQQESVIPDLLRMYQKHKSQDPILREYALGTYYHSIRNYNGAISSYSNLLKQNPELVKVRFKLAEWLLEDHQYYSSKNQLMSLAENSKLPEFIQKRVSLYQDIIKLRQEPKFRLRLSYIQDDNINNASSEQYIILGKTKFKKQRESLPQKAKGVNYHFNIDKMHNIMGNHNFYIENELSGKYYWDNKPYNETENNLYMGYQYQNFRKRIAILPFYNYQWLSQKRYSYGVGSRIEFDRKLSKSWQFSSVFEFDKTNYKNSKRIKYKQLYSTTFMYINDANRYLLIGVDIINERLPFKRDSSIRYSARLGIQQVLNHKIVLNMNLHYAKRYFRGNDYFVNYKRKDNEWGFSTILSKPDWHILGFIPKIQYRYQKIDSNISEFFSFNKQQVNFFFEKKF